MADKKNFEYLDNEKISNESNEKINNKQDKLSEKSENITEDKESALKSLSEIEKITKEKLTEDIDIDLIYNKNESKYYFVNTSKANELGYKDFNNLSVEEILKISFNPINFETGEENNIGTLSSNDLEKIANILIIKKDKDKIENDYDEYKNKNKIKNKLQIDSAIDFDSLIKNIKNIPDEYFTYIQDIKNNLDGSGVSQKLIFKIIFSTKEMQDITNKIVKLNKEGKNFYKDESFIEKSIRTLNNNVPNNNLPKNDLYIDDSYINDSAILTYENVEKILKTKNTEYINEFLKEYAKYLNEKINKIK